MADRHSHKPSKFKQQNKPFKGRGKSQSKKKALGRVAPAPHVATDWAALNKKDRLNAQLQRRRSHRQDLLDKRRNLTESAMVVDGQPLPPVLIGLLALNAQSDSGLVKHGLEQLCEAADNQIFKLPKNVDKHAHVQFVTIERTEAAVLDWCKVLDVLVVTSSCVNADLNNIKTNPNNCQAIDELGYSFLTAIRTQGMPSVVGFVHDANELPKKQKEARKLYLRYLESEFPDVKVIAEDFEALLRTLGPQLYSTQEPKWKSMRAYMLAMQHVVEGSNLVVQGFLRGSGWLHPDSLVHVTGYGDFELEGINTGSGLVKSELIGHLDPVNCPDAFVAEQTWPTEEELASAFSQLEVVPGDHVPCALIDEQEDESYLVEENKAVLELQSRSREDMDFPDEVDTPNDQLAKERFQKYRGLASFRNSAWDPYENLPREYARLFEFTDHPNTIKKAALQEAAANSLTYRGQWVTLVIRNFPVDKLCAHSPGLPLIVSSVLPHERKLSVLHFKLERWGDVETPVASKQPLLLNCGFRRFECRPIYSEDAANSDKFAYLREFKDAGMVVGSIYAPSMFPPANVLAYSPATNYGLVAVGKLLGFDPKRLVIKRILLTGYPVKSHKRKAVVRYMFLDPKDVKYFKPVEMFTKHGLRGHIIDSIGTHGNFKCVFNDFVRHDDIVCLPLYKRVYPVWDEAVWTSIT